MSTNPKVIVGDINRELSWVDQIFHIQDREGFCCTNHIELDIIEGTMSRGCYILEGGR